VRVAIHQPQYLPWLGYLAKWAAADLFVFLDTVQYEKNGWQNRNRIKTAEGPRWLTVPVRSRFGTRIADVAIDTEQPWAARHLRALESAYGAAPYWRAWCEPLASLYSQPADRLVPVVMASAELIARAIGVAAPARLASTLAVDHDEPTERLIALCRAVGGDTYLAGGHGARYMDAKRFADAGIRVLYQAYSHPVYAQQHGDFVPFLSSVDLLLMHGDASLAILRRGDAWSEEP
jgi:WbqC-like protein family